MIDCPEKLHSGADLIVSLSFYMLPGAFKRYKAGSESSKADKRVPFFEGTETREEEMLRNRKESLQQLFGKLGLMPKKSAASASSFGKENVPPEGPQQTKQGDGGQIKKEFGNSTAIKLDEEEASEDDAETLNETDLDVIYKRFVLNVCSV